MKDINQFIIANAVKQSINKDSLPNEFFDRYNSVRITPGVESGRTLTEMLGVLAIIGVLTVGGVAGFNYAMTRYKANEIIEGVKQRAVIGFSQRLQDVPVDFHEFPDTILAFATEGFDEGLNHEPEQFTIDVSNVPQAVCQIIRRLWKM